MPLSLRDVIWLEAAEKIEELDKLEIRKSELKIERERYELMFNVMADLRHIQLSKMYFKTDVAFKDFLDTLPSFKGDAKKNKADRRWKIRKREPGEIPEWKKKQLAELSAQQKK